MIFTDWIFLYFFVIVFVAYWIGRTKLIQNSVLLVASYIFYGWIHPWFCILIAASTITDYICGIEMQKRPEKKKLFLALSLVVNLGMLGFFKYFNFFADNVHAILQGMGLNLSPFTLKIFLPVGISFYTFQTLSYTIDIYRGKLDARKNFIDFAVFVASFPQLVAGPIERAKRFLPQLEKTRTFKMSYFSDAIPLLVRGYLKKLVIADNVAVFSDKVYMLENPSFLILLAGTLAFTLQIYADFSAYTDIARGSARLLGLDLVRNFKNPYVAISPSDFWRRWHISFSSWIRDYLYISMGGSRVNSSIKFLFVLISALGLSGLWHGAAWHFVIWGVFHALIVFVYHKLGIGGRWQPQTSHTKIIAWFVMFCLTVIGWMLFRTSSMEWLIHAFQSFGEIRAYDMNIVAVEIMVLTLVYSLPLFLFSLIDDVIPKHKWVHSVIYGFSVALIIMFVRGEGQDFIYFQF